MGRLDFARHALTLGTNGKVIPLQMSEVGHYILSAADFPQPRRLVRRDYEISCVTGAFAGLTNRSPLLARFRMDLSRRNSSRHVRRRRSEMQETLRRRAPRKSL